MKKVPENLLIKALCEVEKDLNVVDTSPTHETALFKNREDLNLTQSFSSTPINFSRLGIYIIAFQALLSLMIHTLGADFNFISPIFVTNALIIIVSFFSIVVIIQAAIHDGVFVSSTKKENSNRETYFHWRGA